MSSAQLCSFFRSKLTLGKTLVVEQRQIAWKVTEIGRISVVMYDSDQFLKRKLQLTH